MADTVGGPRVDAKRCPECGAAFGADVAFCPNDGVGLTAALPAPTADPLTGQWIDGRYEVLSPIGEGGMGTVYKVRHVTLDSMFAMKVLRRNLANDAGLAARFLQEARATAAIAHPSVVAINDFGVLEGGVPYFVMDLLVGETLAAYMRARGIVPPPVAVSIATKLAEGLSAAHEAGVVHRDLKPENVFLVGPRRALADEVRIVDFGAAKIIGGSALTRPGVVFGTAHYMSPEQASGEPVDARADIYSLGILLYEMLTGNVPFEADTYMGVLTKHMFATPTRPSERMGVQLGQLEDVVLRALEKSPSARYPSMTEFAAALQRAIAEHASEPRPVRDAARAVGLSHAARAVDRIQASVTRHVESEVRRSWRFVALAAAAALVVLAAGALAVTRVRRTQRATSHAISATTEPLPAAATSPSPSPVALSSSLSSSPSPSRSSTGASPPPSPRLRPPKALDSPAAPASKPRPRPQPSSARPARGDDFTDPWDH